MQANHTLLSLLSFLLYTFNLQAQSVSDSTGTKKEKKYQPTAPSTQPFGKEAFQPSNSTTIRWLGMAGFLVNSRGTTFMIDPLLQGYAFIEGLSYQAKSSSLLGCRICDTQRQRSL